jgi:hypothetical protein
MKAITVRPKTPGSTRSGIQGIGAGGVLCLTGLGSGGSTRVGVGPADVAAELVLGIQSSEA